MSSHPSERPTWTSAGSLQAVLLGLASGGVCLAAASPRRRCALTAPFHPCRRAAHVWPRAEAVYFCGTFPRVSPGRCRRPPCPVMSGLSSKANLRGCLACPTTVARAAPARQCQRSAGHALPGRGRAGRTPRPDGRRQPYIERIRPTTRPSTRTSRLRIGSISSFSGCRRTWSASRK